MSLRFNNSMIFVIIRLVEFDEIKAPLNKITIKGNYSEYMKGLQ
jgi:hypothetical protein